MPAQVNQAGIITILRFITPIHTCEATGDSTYGISITTQVYRSNYCFLKAFTIKNTKERRLKNLR